MKKFVLGYLGFYTLVIIGLAMMPGRPEANSHPDLRGGGDYGFGGSDYYERSM